jgi:hypothetical protein
LHFSYNYSVTLNGCANSGLDGNTDTVTGSGIAVTGTSDWSISGQLGNETFNSSDNASITGNLEVGGDVSMSCDISVTEQLTQAGSGSSMNESGNITGELCGQQVNYPMTVTVTVSH